jgi:K+-transporting ATPase c subunit
MPAWKSQNYGSNFQNNYFHSCNPNSNNNTNNNGVSGSNLSIVESSLKSSINSQNEQNKMLMKITKIHDTLIAKLSNQAVSMKSDMQDVQERTKTVEA